MGCGHKNPDFDPAPSDDLPKAETDISMSENIPQNNSVFVEAADALSEAGNGAENTGMDGTNMPLEGESSLFSEYYSETARRDEARLAAEIALQEQLRNFLPVRFRSFRWLWWPLYYVVVFVVCVGIGVAVIFGGSEAGTVVPPVLGSAIAVLGTFYFQNSFPRGVTVLDGNFVHNATWNKEAHLPVRETTVTVEGFYIAFYYGVWQVRIFNTARARETVRRLPFLSLPPELRGNGGF